MTSLARHERTLLSALAHQLGPDAPTLCGDWTVRELLAHLIIRERRPAGIGIVLPPLGGMLAAATRRELDRDFSDLVADVRNGPPFYSPFGIPKVGSALNTMEFFIHHEDIRRAQEGWSPRTLPASTEDVLWRTLAVAGRLLALRSPVPVTLERTDTGARMTLRPGAGVVVKALPSEAALFLYGRQEHAVTEIEGDPDAVRRVAGADLGL